MGYLIRDHDIAQLKVGWAPEQIAGRLGYDGQPVRVTENKHLSAVLAYIKAEQEKAAPPPKVKPVSAKNGYKKTGRRPSGRPSKLEAYHERRRKERAVEAS